MYEDYMIKRKKRNRNIIILIGLGLLILCACIAISDASIPVNGYVNGNTIYWNWTNPAVQNIAIDGIIIENFDNKTMSYQQIFDKDIYSTTHTIGIHSASDNGYNTSLTIIPNNSITSIFDLLYLYFFILATIILLAVSVFIGASEISLVAFIFCLLGYGFNGINNVIHPEMGILYVLGFIVCLFFGLIKD